MDISIEVINACKGLLLVDESPGVNMERDLKLSKVLPVFYSIDEVSGYIKNKSSCGEI